MDGPTQGSTRGSHRPKRFAIYFSENGGEGRRPFEIFPKIHPIW